MNKLSKIFIALSFVIFALGCSDDIVSDSGSETSTTELSTETESGSSTETESETGSIDKVCLDAGEPCDPNDSSCCSSLHCPAGANDPVCIPAV